MSIRSKVKAKVGGLTGQFHEKSQTEPDSRLSQGLKSETFVSADFLAQMDFTNKNRRFQDLSISFWNKLYRFMYVFFGIKAWTQI